MKIDYGDTHTLNERYLFHGTHSHLIDVISKDNMDFRLAGDNVGARYGKGAYFASDAKYSDRFSKTDNRGEKFMFLVKVLCGKMTLGDPELKRPPPVDPKNPTSELYACCVDSEKNPKIFCVFDKTQYYPEYLIKYRKRSNRKKPSTNMFVSLTSAIMQWVE